MHKNGGGLARGRSQDREWKTAARPRSRRAIVLADVVIAGAVAEIFGRPVIMADGYVRDGTQLCFIERIRRFVGIILGLRCAVAFPTLQCMTSQSSRLQAEAPPSSRSLIPNIDRPAPAKYGRWR